MKISKLFHWLYAILMFLPIMVFIPNAFYYGFNDQAVAQEKTEQVPQYYESNDIINNGDFIVNNVYTWENSYTQEQIGNARNYFNITILNGNLKDTTGNVESNSSGFTFIRLPNSNYYDIANIIFDFKINSFNADYNNVPNFLLSHFGMCESKYFNGLYQTNEYTLSITDSMSYAWKTTWENQLFSWSYGSFLTQPFLYITNLFNVPATNTLLYCLSYWLNISIIWLCFDVVMYVPLLVHRWLDKGIIE